MKNQSEQREKVDPFILYLAVFLYYPFLILETSFRSSIKNEEQGLLLAFISNYNII